MRTDSFLFDVPSAEATSKIIWPSVASASVSALPSVTNGFLPFSETPLIPVMVSPFLNLPSAGEPGTAFSTLMVTPWYTRTITPVTPMWPKGISRFGSGRDR